MEWMLLAGRFSVIVYIAFGQKPPYIISTISVNVSWEFFFQRSQELSTEHMVKLKLQCSMTELLSTVMLCLQGPSANAKIPISDLRYSPPQSIYTIRQYQLTCTAKPWHLHVYIYFLFHFFH